MGEERITWESLLSTTRERKSNTSTGSIRNEFECDYDRIVGSSSVRRLQDKAQVFPLQANDFTRTRLTHSLEVSAIARSLGKRVGRWLEDEKNESGFTREMSEQLEALLQTAGLIHDLGNPPFGHYGEDVIRKWFKKAFKEKDFLKNALSDSQKREFEYFDGNVQNLRIVSKLQMLNDQYGANFTYGTLATLMKYPWDASNANEQNSKFGYYDSERALVQRIREDIGLKENCRHPAVYLMEAADDITYIGDDIEDGVKKGYIPWEKEYQKLKEKFAKEHPKFFEIFEKHRNGINKEMDLSEQQSTEVRFFRNDIQGYLINVAFTEFTDSYQKIMDFTYEKKELLDVAKPFVKALKMITAKNCFASDEVLKLELVGDKVISGLLDIFVPALFNSEEDMHKTKTYAGKLYAMISSNFKYVAYFNYESNKKNGLDELSDYDKLHLIVDYISGMTDTYALDLYRKLMGISIL